MSGLTFDTGALIGLQRRRPRIANVYTTAVAYGAAVVMASAARRGDVA